MDFKDYLTGINIPNESLNLTLYELSIDFHNSHLTCTKPFISSQNFITLYPQIDSYNVIYPCYSNDSKATTEYLAPASLNIRDTSLTTLSTTIEKISTLTSEAKAFSSESENPVSLKIIDTIFSTWRSTTHEHLLSRLMNENSASVSIKSASRRTDDNTLYVLRSSTVGDEFSSSDDSQISTEFDYPTSTTIFVTNNPSSWSTSDEEIFATSDDAPFLTEFQTSPSETKSKKIYSTSNSTTVGRIFNLTTYHDNSNQSLNSASSNPIGINITIQNFTTEQLTYWNYTDAKYSNISLINGSINIIVTTLAYPNKTTHKQRISATTIIVVLLFIIMTISVILLFYSMFKRKKEDSRWQDDRYWM
ncbi:hypothetical protein RF11_12262 [Thelohanellus kitauei]|uniref:Uncharacterized protein n=1 Tax=Thelohanellus kitauei TaxID=669202 RepID=A0A0C2N8S3_THEKT|nr:hypothetical protein RF11_12262 [Thelohanellus kitauei]